MLEPMSFAAGRWVQPGPDAREILNPVTGRPMGRAGHGGLDMGAMLAFATARGGPALRAMGLHDRARMVKALALHLDGRKEELYALNPLTGATRKDGWGDIDGGIVTMLVFASKARREMPDADIHRDGAVEMLSRDGSFTGRHIATPLRGVAVQINAFNFPVWGMLEKLAPALIAGVPTIVKPATQTSFLAEACVRMILDSGLLPEGALQLVVGGAGDLLDRLGPQDVVSFTGSAETALALRSNRNLLKNATRFIAEQDSLNAAILGPDAVPGTPEFDLFIREAVREITGKTGQKCTAIRRMIVPEALTGDVIGALSERLARIRAGDPADPDTTMGPLVSPAQRADVAEKTARLASEAMPAYTGEAPGEAGFYAPRILLARDPDSARAIHDLEAFGPVATVLAAKDASHAAALANRAKGSLVSSLFTADPAVARRIALEIAPWNGRLYVANRDATQATGHGAPLAHMIHGGPGHAGGGEELGGIRGIIHYMQRTAIQAPPAMLTALTGEWTPGSPYVSGPAHPFRRGFDEIAIGESIETDPRTVTLDDIEHFARFTGDTFYAHMDEEAAAANPFFPGRVAHGYLILSFAAGLFVDPDPGPVLANTGLNALRFEKPVSPGDTIRVRLTARRKTRRTDTYGEVAWHVEVRDDAGGRVAEYELLTMVARRA